MNKVGRNEPCWCKSGKKYKICHAGFDERLETYRDHGAIVPPRKIIKNPEQIQGLRESGKINTAILDYVAQNIRTGITTEQIDQWVYKQTLQYQAIPAPLNYEGFPKSVCTSVNDQVCHGIPSSDVVLKDGDIINVDVSTIYQGYYSDSSRMFCIGEVSAEKQRLVQVTKDSLAVGLEQVKPWGFLGDMGQAIHDFARRHGYTVVREIGGHGIGLEFHEEPWVSYVSKRGEEMLMVPGMVFTIEPMINMGSDEIFVGGSTLMRAQVTNSRRELMTIDEQDDWTVYTADGMPSAQWEIQVLMTEEGYEILAY